MDNFKEASRQQLRFTTNKGVLSVEQLWQLSITDLDSLAVSLESEVEKSGRKSFVVERSEKDQTAKLKFDIVLDVLTTKVKEAKDAKDARETKAQKDKILNLIAEKKDQSLAGKTIEELEAML